MVLQERDRRLLRQLGSLRFITREQAKVVAGFRSTTRANERLLKLFRAGLLSRFFIGSIGAGRMAVYGLSRAGAALVGVPFKPFVQKSRSGAADLFLLHRLRTNDVLLAFQYHLTAYTGARLQSWRDFDGKPLSQAVPLIPDGYLEVELAGQVRAMFLEVDLGTEALSVWRRKTENYLRLATSGEFTRNFAHEQFRVLVVAPSMQRLESIRRTVSALTEKIFWFSTFESINRDGVGSAIWLRPTGDHKQSLL